MRKNIVFFVILLIACILRLYQLGSVPYGVTNDEASYIYSAYSVWHTGRGIDGTFLPLSFNTDSSNSPVPIYISAPFVGILGVSPFSGRLPYAVSGIGSVILVYFIAKKLFQKEVLALSSMFVMAVSPWHIHMSRAAIDGVMALFFYLLGLYLFLRGKEKGNVLWSLIPFFLGFYSYHAMKFFFIFFLPLLLIIYKGELLKQKKQLVFFVVGYVTIILSFFLVGSVAHVTRQESTLLSFSDINVVKVVNFERNTTLAPQKVSAFFNNKFMTAGRIVRENFLEPFSPQFLFLYGDTNSSGATLGLFNRGGMYIIEVPLLLIGLYAVAKKKKITFLLFGGLICAVLPSTFASGKTFAIRDMLMIPFLSILVGAGIDAIREHLKTTTKKQIFILSLGIVYAFFIVNYLYQYYYRYPIYGAQAWMRDRREISALIQQKSHLYSHIFVASSEKDLLMQYGIVGQIDPTLIQAAWQHGSVVGSVQFGFHCLLDKDGKFIEKLPPHSLYIAPGTCNNTVSSQGNIKNVMNPSEVLWKVYEI